MPLFNQTMVKKIWNINTVFIHSVSSLIVIVLQITALGFASLPLSL